MSNSRSVPVRVSLEGGGSQETGSVQDRKRPGRPPKMSAACERHIKLMSLRDRKLTSGAIAESLHENNGLPVHPSTVRRSLSRSKLHGRVAARKPLLRPRNRARRRQFAEEHRGWTNAQWEQVLWTDESKFEIFGSRRRKFVRRRVGERFRDECLEPTVKRGGGSVQVWGCISAHGPGDIVKIDGILNAAKYHQILIHHAIPSGRRLIGLGFILQQDNDPKHTARLVQRFLLRKEEEGTLRRMPWPPQRPDLNIIESVWEHMKREKVKRRPTSRDSLWVALQEIWGEIPRDLITTLVQGVSRRLQATRTARGVTQNTECHCFISCFELCE
uniref:Transposase Tc1-like domain-containing protein n=1 Tax=Amphilophus citrinellus TaxID=61819 RepID=A0A3Q0QR15_AMPCI